MTIYLASRGERERPENKKRVRREGDASLMVEEKESLGLVMMMMIA